MFTKFASFRINNKKITIVVILVILLAGAFSWTVIPKQYNPKIEAPAYNITIPAPGYTSKEVSELIVKPLENKIGEINGVDDIFGYAQNNMGSVMVTFKVGEKKEEATIRLYNKIYSNLNLKTYGVQDPIITNIDPEELPIYTFALYSTDTGTDKIQLRKTALELIDGLKHTEDVRGFFLIGGDKETITISVDIQKAESKNIPLVKITDVIKKNNIGLPGGNIHFGNIVGEVSFDGKFSNLRDIKSLIVGNYNGNTVKLEDIADITFSVPEELQSTRLRTYEMGKEIQKNTIFIGVGKKDGTNAVSVVENIKKRLFSLQKELPSDYQITEIQNLGKKASSATNMLLVNLFQSIIIVLVILTIVLGFKNAINVAISIPLTLSVVFIYSLIIGDNINKITLFALILVLGMLVDDATVVVENINRKLSELKDKKDFKTRLNAIFEAIKEVELGVILSTITRLLAFGAMFFVTGMMGAYVGPIPRYAIVSMITSTIIALSINPFLTNLFYGIGKKNENEEKRQINQKKSEKIRKNNNLFTNIIKKILKKTFLSESLSDFSDLSVKNIKKRLFSFNMNLKNKFNKLGKSFEQKYYNFMNYFLNEKKTYRLKYFKIGFWIILGLVVVIPPAMQIFKMRMLPKSNQNQIFLRIDMPQDSSYTFTKKISDKIESFLIEEYGKSKSLPKTGRKIISSISTRNSIAPMPNFSNIPRNSMSRVGEKYISMRINLKDTSTRSISSEEFVITNRHKIESFVKKIVPDATLRILEDPPGPPTKATFMLKVQGENNNYGDIEQFASWINEKLQPMLKQQKIVDSDTSISSYQTKYLIKFNHQRAVSLGIDAELVAYTIRSVFAGIPITIYHNTNNKEGVNLHITVKDKQKNTQEIFENISVPTSQGGFVGLGEVAELILTEKEHPIYSDNKVPSVYIFGEMGDNSVIYPAIMTFRLLLDKSFWEGKYEVIDRNLYEIAVINKMTSKKYKVGLGGEWELTMDTFRDLGIAMFIAFIAIYFVMVGQFKSFGTGGVIMLSFLFGFFGVFPLFTILFLLNNEYFSATSMIGVIALAGIVVGNAILLLEYTTILLKTQKIGLKDAVIKAGFVRMKPIVVTSLTTIFGATTILGDPVWSGLSYAIIGGLLSSAILTPMILPLFLYRSLKDNKEMFEE